MTSKTAQDTESKIHHIGADIPLDLFDLLRARATLDGVPYTIIIRWALQDFLVITDDTPAAGASS